MPNSNGHYRMFQVGRGDETVIVNASISPLVAAEKLRISQQCSGHAMVDGFYFDSFYICYKSTVLHYNRQLRSIVNCVGDEQTRAGTPCVAVTTDAQPTTYTNSMLGSCHRSSINIVISTNDGTHTIKLSTYTNPQILVGMEVSTDQRTGVTGVLNDVVHPKHYRLKKPDSCKPVVVKEGVPRYAKSVAETFNGCSIENEYIKTMM